MARHGVLQRAIERPDRSLAIATYWIVAHIIPVGIRNTSDAAAESFKLRYRQFAFEDAFLHRIADAEQDALDSERASVIGEVVGDDDSHPSLLRPVIDSVDTKSVQQPPDKRERSVIPVVLSRARYLDQLVEVTGNDLWRALRPAPEILEIEAKLAGKRGRAASPSEQNTYFLVVFLFAMQWAERLDECDIAPPSSKKTSAIWSTSSGRIASS
ncbi:MAG: hypothetical protein R3A46_15065 [Thermomicrobiales bacterium]